MEPFVRLCLLNDGVWMGWACVNVHRQSCTLPRRSVCMDKEKTRIDAQASSFLF